MRHFKFTDMRRHKLNWIWIILLGLFVGSCEDYLDRSPDDGLSADDVYKDYRDVYKRKGWIGRNIVDNC